MPDQGTFLLADISGYTRFLEFRRQRFGGIKRWARESGVTLPDDL